MSIEIRPATERDIPSLNELYSEWRRGTRMDWDGGKVNMTGHEVLIASTGGVAVGYLDGSIEQTELWRNLVNLDRTPANDRAALVFQMYTSLSHRRQGVGLALLQAFEDDARGRGQDLLLVDRDDNFADELNAFYGRAGYRQCEPAGSRYEHILSKWI